MINDVSIWVEILKVQSFLNSTAKLNSQILAEEFWEVHETISPDIIDSVLLNHASARQDIHPCGDEDEGQETRCAQCSSGCCSRICGTDRHLPKFSSFIEAKSRCVHDEALHRSRLSFHPREQYILTSRISTQIETRTPLADRSLCGTWYSLIIPICTRVTPSES